jgi:hypothetical protein
MPDSHAYTDSKRHPDSHSASKSNANCHAGSYADSIWLPWRLYTIANVDSNGHSNSYAHTDRYAHDDSKCYSYTHSNSYADFDAETFTNAETGANA